jgi:hypothetical protein
MKVGLRSFNKDFPVSDKQNLKTHYLNTYLLCSKWCAGCLIITMKSYIKVYFLYCWDNCSSSAMSTTHFFCSSSAFAGWEKRLWLSSCTSVCLHGTTRLVVGFYSNIILGIFIKIWLENSSLVKIEQKTLDYVKTWVRVWLCRWILIHDRSFKQKYRKWRLIGNAFLFSNNAPFKRLSTKNSAGPDSPK